MGSDTRLVNLTTACGCFEGCWGALGSGEEAQRGEGKESALARSKGKENSPSQVKYKRKMVESPNEGAPKKKLLALAIQEVVGIFITFFVL